LQVHASEHGIMHHLAADNSIHAHLGVKEKTGQQQKTGQKDVYNRRTKKIAISFE
jgi:hypothetical protein